MEREDRPSKTHVLIFPFPAQGHMIPLLDFTHCLAVRGGAAVTITVLVTPKNLPFLSHLLSSAAAVAGDINPLVLPFPTGHSSIPTGVENVKDLPPSGFASMIYALRDLHAPLLSWFNSHPSPPVAIVSDIFLGWTHRLAIQLGLRRFAFSPSAAVTCCALNYLWLDLPARSNEEDESEVIEFRKLPNCPKYPWWQVSSIYRMYVRGEPFWEFIKDVFRDNTVSWGLIVNSFSELERVYLEHLKRDMGHNRVWAVGPVLPLVGDFNRGGPASVAADHVMSWLDARADDQVVYVCFGSQTVLTKEQTTVMALGLEKSEIHFVWAVKDLTEDTSPHGIIPVGFEDRVAGRGLVIKGWAPQVSILTHRAVGAFLTHCGWNSVIEAVVAGVIMLTWPMRADQFIDASLIVDQIKMGMRVCEGPDSVPDSDELARVLAESVAENQGERQRAKKLSDAALNAIKEGGSSVQDIDAFIKHIVSLGLEN